MRIEPKAQILIHIPTVLSTEVSQNKTTGKRFSKVINLLLQLLVAAHCAYVHYMKTNDHSGLRWEAMYHKQVNLTRQLIHSQFQIHSFSARAIAYSLFSPPFSIRLTLMTKNFFDYSFSRYIYSHNFIYAQNFFAFTTGNDLNIGAILWRVSGSFFIFCLVELSLH